MSAALLSREMSFLSGALRRPEPFSGLCPTKILNNITIQRVLEKSRELSGRRAAGRGAGSAGFLNSHSICS